MTLYFVILSQKFGNRKISAAGTRGLKIGIKGYRRGKDNRLTR